ncbi:MAG: MFS transporter [Bacteroidota bacterium]
MTETAPAPGSDSSRIERKNFLLNAAEGALFISSTAFINPQTVLPALVSRLGGSNIVIGALGVLVYFGAFLPQIFSARHVETLPWKKKWALALGTTQRSFVLLTGVMLLAFGGDRPAIALWTFMVLYTLMQLAGGVTTPGWYELFAKLTPPRKRGRLVGIRTSLGGAGAFVCGLLLTWLLGTYAFPLSFALAFFCAYLLQMSSIATQYHLIEQAPSATTAHRPIDTFLRELPNVLRNNPPFRAFVSSSALLTVAAMPIGFYTVYALHHFHADESVVGEFTLTMVAVQVVSALVNGFIADRYGNKLVLAVAASALLLASLIALVAPTLGWFRLVYVLLGVNLGTETMTRYNISVEYGPANQRSTYIGLMNTMLAPFYLSGMVGGMLAEWLGFGAVFAGGVIFSVIGILALVQRVADPRTLQTAGSHG